MDNGGLAAREENQDNESLAAQEENQDVAMGFIGSLGPTADDVASEMILMAMGSCGKSRLRETRSACRRLGKAMVSEMYSPPRVTAELKRSQHLYRHLIPGFALDLTVLDEDGVPWDFNSLDKREKARRIVREQKPSMVIGSPACK
jgi:molybdopterin-biosynthesis enzyme MoeA-like protein